MFEKEAEEYADKYKPNFVVNEHGSTVYTRLDIEQAFLAGAGYNKAQIEKMKLCQNCKFEDNDFMEEPCSACTRCLGEDIKREGDSDKWEIKEND